MNRYITASDAYVILQHQMLTLYYGIRCLRYIMASDAYVILWHQMLSDSDI